MKHLTEVGTIPFPGVTPGELYLLRDKHRDRGTEVETLHVMSKPLGGQIRGYRRENGGEWKVWLPAYEGHWPEMDQAVATLIGEPLIDLNGKRVDPLAPDVAAGRRTQGGS